MTGIKDYSATPGNNTALFPEGMAPSAVNDGMRQVQADIREWYNEAQWIAYGDGDSAFTVSFASATSFAIAGADVTAQYHAGRRVKASGSLTGTIYGTITSSSFSTNTTVNVLWDSGGLENEAIAVHLGILSATDQAMPQATATLTGAQTLNAGMTGEIRMWAAAAAPSGWRICDGAALSRTTFAALFAVIGTTWGAGDGSTTFNVPDLRGRVFIGAGQGVGLTNRVLGATGGEEGHVLSPSEMPSHSHGAGSLATSSAGTHTHDITHNNTTGGTAGSNVAGNSLGNNSTAPNAALSDGAHTHDVTGTTANAGSGGAHNNMPPFAIGNWIIKT